MHLPLTHLSALLALACTCGAAQAQYKVVNPDGSVTYTDRPPAASNVRVTQMNRSVARSAMAQELPLPPELRSVTQRHPVTLFTTAECAPCDNGRKLLQQRGVPYNEKRISTEEDALALERIVGARSVPALTVGAQPVRGWSESDWNTYLDVAGYPKDNRLPRGWQAPQPVPLVERVAASNRGAAPPAPPPPPAEPPVEEPPAQETGTRIRF